MKTPQPNNTINIMEKDNIEKIIELVKGKTIKNIFYGGDLVDIDNYGIDNDGGNITIELSDGSKIVVWNSEWGGLVYGNK